MCGEEVGEGRGAFLGLGLQWETFLLSRGSRSRPQGPLCIVGEEVGFMLERLVF